MYSLQLLGGLSLSGPNGPIESRAAQPRRLALLALLSLAPRRTMSRDRLMALLWPEGELREARRNLSSALYDLRDALGHDALVSVNVSVSLNESIVSSDVDQFEAAVRDKRWDDALTCYGGPLLDGIYLVPEVDFERWVDSERQRLDRLYQQAVEAAALAAEARRSGEVSSPPSSLSPGQSSPAPPSRRRARLRLAGVGLAAAVLLGTVLTQLLSTAPPAITRIAVFPFRGFGSPEAAQMGQSVVDLLSLGLDGAGELRTVDPAVVLAKFPEGQPSPEALTALAGRLGATHYVLGTVHAKTDRIRLSASLYPSAGGEADAQASVEGDPAQLIRMVDQLGVALLAARLHPIRERIAKVGAVSTTSLPALKAWLTGETAFRRGSYRSAADAFEQATVLDSTFALAHYRYSLASLWGDRPGTATDMHDAAALRHAERLAPRDRQLLEAYAAWRQGDPDLAEYRYRRILDLWPDDLEAWHQLGETRFHYNPIRGRPIAASREAFERVLALDPGHRGSRWHLSLLDARAGRAESVRQILAELAAGGDGDDGGMVEPQILLIAQQSAIGRADGPGGLESADENTLTSAAWRLAVFLGDLGAAERVARYLVAADRNDYARAMGRQTLAHLAMARGKLRQALEECRRIPGSTSGYDGELAQATLLTHWWLEPQAELVGKVRDRLLTRGPGWDHTLMGRLHIAGLLDLALGDSVAWRRDLTALRATTFNRALGNDLALALEASIAIRAGQPDSALAALGRMGPPGWFGQLVTGALRGNPQIRFVWAEALLAAGRDEEAAGWYQSLGEHSLQDLAYLAPAQFRLGEILERQGKFAEARTRFTRFVKLWADADPEFQPWLAAARSHLEDLPGYF